jgi:hypothetical protein
MSPIGRSELGDAISRRARFFLALDQFWICSLPAATSSANLTNPRSIGIQIGSNGISRRHQDFQPSLAFVVVVAVGVSADDGNPHDEQYCAKKLKN